MASLLFVDDIKKEGRTALYDPDTWYNNSTRSFSLELPNEVYQFSLAVHWDQFESDKMLWSKIRQFVNRNLLSDVVASMRDLSYTIKQPYMSLSGYRKHSSFEVQNRWHLFYFDNEEEHTLFKLTLPCVLEPTNLHPSGKHDSYHHIGARCWTDELPNDSSVSSSQFYKYFDGGSF